MNKGWCILSFKTMPNFGYLFSFNLGSHEISRYLFACKKRIKYILKGTCYQAPSSLIRSLHISIDIILLVFSLINMSGSKWLGLGLVFLVQLNYLSRFRNTTIKNKNTKIIFFSFFRFTTNAAKSIIRWKIVGRGKTHVLPDDQRGGFSLRMDYVWCQVEWARLSKPYRTGKGGIHQKSAG